MYTMNGTGIIAVDLSLPECVQFFAGRPSKQSDLPRSSLSLSVPTHPRRQKLRGKLRIVVSQPVRLNLVEIRFHGHTELAWRDPLKSEHSFLAERMNARKTLRKSKSTLLEEATLPAGVTELGFEITVPGHLCPSFRSKFVDIAYTVAAKVVPAGGKLSKKPIRVEKDVRVEKTLMPHDIATLAGYRVPRLSMTGAARRAGDTALRCEFRVPKWVCLNSGTVQFNGTFSVPPSSAITSIAKIEVDVVEQHFYHYEMKTGDQQEGKPAEEAPMAFGDRLTKRHLLLSHSEPSVYLFPPLDASIAFSFPVNQHPPPSSSSVHDLSSAPSRVKSVPYAPTRIPPPDDDPLPLSCSWVLDSAQYYAPATVISKANLSCSLDSPFLEIRHFIRLVIHPLTDDDTAPQPICFGLPIHITQALVPPPPPDGDDELPTYSSIIRGATESLPDYVTTMMDLTTPVDTDDDGAISPRLTTAATLHQEGQLNEVDISDLYSFQARSRQSTQSSEHSSTSSTYTKQGQSKRILIQERRLEDFWIMP